MSQTKPTVSPGASRLRGLAFGALALVVLVLGTLVALVLGGAAAPQTLADPGAVVRWGLPLVRGIFDFSMAIAIGTLALVCFAAPNRSPEFRKLTSLAGLASGVWALSGIVALIFTYLSVTGLAFSGSASFGQGLWLFVTEISLGQALGWNIAIAALVAVLSLALDRLLPAIFVAALALGGVIPIALTGHAAGTQGHGMAVNALGLHLVGVSLWVGGLVALLWVYRGLADERLTWTRRYSALALVAFVLVAVSGVASAAQRFNGPADLFGTGYGQIVFLKIVLLVLAGGMGAWYRLRLLRAERPPMAKLFALEVLLMVAAVGLAGALGRTEPPKLASAPTDPTPAQILTGELLPPELTASAWFTAFKPDLIWALVVVLGMAFYAVGVLKLRKRGDTWPVIRTVSWFAGLLVLGYITNGAMNVYEQYLFSVHMIAHMMLTMAVPVLLVPGAPVTLLMRAVEKRHDASMGVREWVLWAVHTPWARFVSHPIVAGVNFAASLVIFYFTPLFGLATREHVGHEWMILHFLITGYLFVQALIGIDPGPKKLAYPIRLILLLGTLTFHAFFGLALMQGSGLILADWFGAMGRIWGQSPIADQKTGGAIAWGVGELPAAVLTLIVSIQWARADGRESKRLDRASDRGGNQDLEQYNQMLARLAEREERKR